MADRNEQTEVKIIVEEHSAGAQADGMIPEKPVFSVTVKESAGATADGILVPEETAEELVIIEDEPAFDVSAIVGVMKSVTVDENAPKPQPAAQEKSEARPAAPEPAATQPASQDAEAKEDKKITGVQMDQAESVAVYDPGEAAYGEGADEASPEQSAYEAGAGREEAGPDGEAASGGFIPDGPVTIIGVRFRPAGKMYYFSPGEFEVRRGMNVIVETARGVEFGTVAAGPMTLGCPKFKQPLRVIRRIATEEDAAHREENLIKERKAYQVCQEKIAKHGLEMKLISAEYSFDDSKIMFYFTADGRVDFRDLVKELAGVFRTRIELRQIGVRDETRILGGYGICGRPLCCASYLSDFIPVSIKMAKEQNLSLNPTKISGVCGRLMCCLKNEEETYEELNRNLPGIGDEVEGNDGLVGEVESVNVLRQTIRILVEVDDEKELHEYSVGDFTLIRKRRRGGKGGGKEAKEQQAAERENAPRENAPRESGAKAGGGSRENTPKEEEIRPENGAPREKGSERGRSSAGGRRGRRGVDPARPQRSAEAGESERGRRRGGPAEENPGRRRGEQPEEVEGRRRGGQAEENAGRRAEETGDGMFGHAYRPENAGTERRERPEAEAGGAQARETKDSQSGAPRRRRRDFRRRRSEGNRDASSR